MSLETYGRALDFLQRSGIGQVRLLGGEPTTHPQLSQMIMDARDRGLSVLVFSSGMMSEEVLGTLEETDGAGVEVLLNLTPHDCAQEFPDPLQLATLRRLGGRVRLGYTITDAAPRLDRLLDLIEELSLVPAIRLGLAHPGDDPASNSLLPRLFPAVGERVAGFLEAASERSVHVGFDCGFVACMFSPEARALFGHGEEWLGYQCGPTLDLLPDGTFISCFPLANLGSIALTATVTAAQLRQGFGERLAPYRAIGIFPACSRCRLRDDGVCPGGCIATSMRRLRRSSSAIDPPLEREWPRLEAPPSCEEVQGGGGASCVTVPAPSSRGGVQEARWVIPYVDQPIDFWLSLAGELGEHVASVYVPFPLADLGSGRPPQPITQLAGFLRQSPLPCSLLINPIVLREPASDLAPRIVAALRRLTQDVPVNDVTIANLELASRVREAMPGLSLTASVLMDIATPLQAEMVKGIFDTIVPASRIMRNLAALTTLREAFPGRLRLIVNEACLPGCPFRIQHFFEMTGARAWPASLCSSLISEKPWLSLTGAWVLPQHLHLFAGVFDEAKLAGRVTLREPERYLEVLRSYVHRRPLTPDRIGGGPASPQAHVEVTEAYYRATIECGQQCHSCTVCRDYHERLGFGVGAAQRHGSSSEVR